MSIYEYSQIISFRLGLTPVVLALMRPKQEAYSEFEANLCYIVPGQLGLQHESIVSKN